MSISSLTPTSLGNIKIQKLSEMAPRVNMVIYGMPGVGKTLISASADAVPAMRKVLLMDIDGGALSAKEKYPNADRVVITRWSQINEIYVELAANPNLGYQTVIMDTGTEAQKYSQAAVMARAVKLAADKGEVRDVEVPSFREWGITAEHMRNTVRRFRDLPMNFIMTLHVKDDKNEMTGKVSKVPDLPGKLARQIAGFFDVVLYMYIKEVPDRSDPEGKAKIEKRLLQSVASELVIAKDRSDRLPPFIQDLSMKFLYNTINGVKSD